MPCDNCTGKEPGQTINVTSDLKHCGICGDRIRKTSWHACSQPNLMELHVRALCAHSECLGINASNFYNVVNNLPPQFDSRYYTEILQKWGLINDKGEPTLG